MTKLTKHIEPGSDVSLADVKANFSDLSSASSSVGKDEIDVGSIDYRHLSGDWKYVAGYRDYSTSIASGAIATTELLLPTSAGVYTRVGVGNPVVVVARLMFAATGNSYGRFGIYVGGAKVGDSMPIRLEADRTQSYTLFYMYKSTLELELIEFRADTASGPTAANFTISDFEMSIFSVRS